MVIMRMSALVAALALPPLPAAAQPAERQPPGPQPAQELLLDELDRRADELSDAARQTVEEFVNLVGPMLIRLSRLIEGLPTYEAPEILPNGDIIIRRKPDPLEPVPPVEADDGLTET